MVARQRFWRELWQDERGVTAFEYALIASFIAVVILGAVTTYGMNMKRAFSTIASDA